MHTTPKRRAGAVAAVVVGLALVTGCGSAASPSGGVLDPASAPARSVSQPSGAGTSGAALAPTRANVPAVARNCQSNGGDESDPTGADGSNGASSQSSCVGGAQGSAGDRQAGDSGSGSDQGGDNQAGDSGSGSDQGGDNQAGDNKGNGP
jgi:hypothetical protein